MTDHTDHTDQGWRITPKPGGRLRRTEAGRFTIPMIVIFDGERRSEIDHVYTGGQIEDLYRQMCALLNAGVPAREDRRAQEIEMGLFYE